MARYIGYARVSTVEQGKNYSIENQKRNLEKRAKTLGLEFLLFSDVFSGSSVSRAGFQAMELELKPGDVLGVQYVDRLSRSDKDNEEAKAIAKKWWKAGVKIEVAGVEFDFDNPSDELMFGMHSLVASFQRKTILKKSREGIDAKKEKGEWIFSPRLYGYRHTGNPSQPIELIDHEAETIREIFDLYISGLSLQAVSDHLTQKGVLSRKGKPFTAHHIRRTVLNPIFTGHYKPQVMGHHPTTGKYTNRLFEKNFDDLIKSKFYPPIISLEKFFEAIESHREVVRVHAQQFNPRETPYLLGSVFSCAECGEKATHSYVKKNGHTYDVYTLNKHHKKCSKGLAVSTFRRERFDPLILEVYRKSFEFPQAQKPFLDKVEKELRELVTMEKEKLELGESRIQDIDRAINEAKKHKEYLNQKARGASQEVQKDYFMEQAIFEHQKIKDFEDQKKLLLQELEEKKGKFSIAGVDIVFSINQETEEIILSNLIKIRTLVSQDALDRFDNVPIERKRKILLAGGSYLIHKNHLLIEFFHGLKVKIGLVKSRKNILQNLFVADYYLEEGKTLGQLKFDFEKNQFTFQRDENLVFSGDIKAIQESGLLKDKKRIPIQFLNGSTAKNEIPIISQRKPKEGN